MGARFAIGTFLVASSLLACADDNKGAQGDGGYVDGAAIDVQGQAEAGGRPAADATGVVDAANDVVEAMTDAMDSGIDVDATASDVTASDATPFPDAAVLSGLRIGFLGDVGAFPQTSLDAFLASSATVTRIHTSSAPGGPLAASDLASFDVVILDQLTRVYTPAEAQTLADWVAGGGAALSLTGYTGNGPDATRPNSLLAVIGIQYGTFLGGTYDVPPLIAHPVMKNVAHVKFEGGYEVRVQTSDAGTSAPDAGADTVVAQIDATHDALIVQERGSGRVVVWGDEWIEYDSEFASNPSNQQFWVDVLLWLTHRA
jgi:hypothetical protein